MKKIVAMLLTLIAVVGMLIPRIGVKAQEEGVKHPVVEDKRVYVTADWVKERLDENPEKVVLAEVTWGEADASPDYLKEHIPGAIHINTDKFEEGPVWNLRSPEELAKALADYGVTHDTQLILYGPDTGVDRVAYASLYTGVADVKILDGGLKQWKDAGYDLEAEEVKPTPVDDFGVEAPVHPEYLLSLDQTVDELANNDNFRLVSLRSEREWLGLESGYSYIPKAGEPKGAVWGRPGLRGSGEANISDMEDYKNEDGTNKDFDEILAMWEEEGFGADNDLSFYCGTGWRSCLPWLMMYERGLDATMYDGGWNEWQMHDDLDVQLGDPKSDDVQYVKVKDLKDGMESK